MWPSAMSWCLGWMPWLSLVVLPGNDVPVLLKGTELSCVRFRGRACKSCTIKGCASCLQSLFPTRAVKRSDEGQDEPTAFKCLAA